MSRTPRFHPRHPLVVTGLALIGLVASLATTSVHTSISEGALVHRNPAARHHVIAAGNHSPTPVDDSRVDLTSAYFAEFTGVGADGRDMVWRGAVAGGAVGELTVRLAHVGRDVDAAKPMWPVEGIISVSGEDPRRAFAAEVHGTIDWPAKRVRLAGEVSVGYVRGTRIELTADLVNCDLSGELRAAAERRRPLIARFARSPW